MIEFEGTMGDNRIQLDYAQPATGKRMGFNVKIMLAMAATCMVNLGFDFLLFNTQIGESPNGLVIGSGLLVYALGWLTAVIGAITFVAVQKSLISCILMSVFIVTIYVNWVVASHAAWN